MNWLARFTNLVGLCCAVTSAARATPAAEGPSGGASAEPAPSEAPVAAYPADEPDTAEADRIFREARELLKQGKYGEACPKLEQSHRLDPALGTLLNLGVCYEEWGKVASAWRVYRQVADEAHERGQANREALAMERIVAIEIELPRLVFDFEGAEPSSVSLNGESLPSSAWNAPVPVDPGTHHVEVRSTRHGFWAREVEVSRSQLLRLVVSVLEPIPKPNAATPPPPVKDAGASKVESRPGGSSKGSPAKTAAVVLGGVGAGAAVVGSVFGLLAYSTHASSSDECGPRGACTVEGRELRDKSFDQAMASTVAFGIAVASVSGALALWFTAPGSATTRKNVRMRATVSPTHLGLGTGVDF